MDFLECASCLRLVASRGFLREKVNPLTGETLEAQPSGAKNHPLVSKTGPIQPQSAQNPSSLGYSFPSAEDPLVRTPTRNFFHASIVRPKISRGSPRIPYP